MTSQGTPRGRFQRAIHSRHVQNAEIAAREMGGLSLADALLLCELLANTDPARYERAALRWLQRFIDERLPALTEVALAATALAEARHGNGNVGVETLKRLIRRVWPNNVPRRAHHPTLRGGHMAERRFGGLTVGGILVIAGILIWIFWSFWIGLIVALIGLVAFGGFARGKWY
jgi:hypothetical protein